MLVKNTLTDSDHSLMRVCVSQLCVCVAAGLSDDQLHEEEVGGEKAESRPEGSTGTQQTRSHQVESFSPMKTANLISSDVSFTTEVFA